MIYLLAILLPTVALLIRGHFWQALICLLLHLTVVGWLPAALWAVFVIHEDEENRRTREFVNAMRQR